MFSISQKNTGVISVTALVFMGIFVAVLSGLLSTAVSQKKVETAKQQGDQALQIADAGLDYYKWFLAHFPDDMQDGTGAPGPYIHDYADPEGGNIGKFSLVVNGNYQCGSLSRVTITSTGWVNANPDITKIVSGVYGRPTIGEYSYILNSDVWAGADRIINGPYHSNGGIRMDGTNFAQVTSAKTTWNCTTGYGCTPANASAPGVVGGGPGFALWSWPVVPVDFAAVTLNLGDMKNKTASTTPSVCTAGQTYGCYFPASGGVNKGYHAVFLNNGTMNLYKVTATRSTNEYNSSTGNQAENNLIRTQVLVAGSPFTLPTACPMVFVEDKLWIDGTVKGKISIAAADLGAADPDLILSGNIEYTTLSGSDGLLAIGENRVLVSFDSPNDMTTRGIFLAQKGYFGRNYINTNPSGSPFGGTFCAAWDNCRKRNSMTIYGTVVSNGRVGTKWNCTPPAGGVYCQGYNFRTDSYDSRLANDPPPMTPAISDTYKFLKWTQDK